MSISWYRPFVKRASGTIPHTMVIGAGLVGPLWAIMLQQLGVTPQVYERRANDRKGKGRSVNLVITARGINALQKIGLWKKISALTIPVFGRMIHDRKGGQKYQPYGRDESECNYSISRGEFNQFLHRECEDKKIPIHFEHNLTTVDVQNRLAIFSNGKSLPFQRLFATDGGSSAVRSSLREQIPSAREDIQDFSVGYKEMLMPAMEGGQYAIKEKALHIWPRGQEMLMALPNRDGSFTMTLFMPKQSFTGLNTRQKLREHFQQQYPDAIPLMPHYEDQFLDNPQGHFSTVRFSPWNYQDRICLLGDAAHAIVPFFGQGLNCGLEDCAILFDLWHHQQNWQQVFEKFDQIQRPNGNAIATMAIENYVEMAERVGDEKFLLRKKIEHKIETTFPQLYRSRYGMVTYTLIPYHLAYEAGKIQNKILDKLLGKLLNEPPGNTQPLANDLMEKLDLGQAKQLIEEQLIPFLKQHNLH